MNSIKRTLLLMSVGVMMNIHGALNIGDAAPNFNLADETGRLRSLSEFNNQKVVIFFYPKAGSAHCTAQACSLRDSSQTYKDHSIAILGISYDTPEANKKFKEEHHLPFTLLSDTDKTVAQAYGLRSGLWGKTVGYFVPLRVTFLIDHGKIVKVLHDINVSDHAHQVLEAFGIK